MDAEYPIRLPNSSRSSPSRTRSVFMVCPNATTTPRPPSSSGRRPAPSSLSQPSPRLTTAPAPSFSRSPGTASAPAAAPLRSAMSITASLPQRPERDAVTALSVYARVHLAYNRSLSMRHHWSR
ncbi:hypothetical protein ACH40E_31385 [Streptomyces acidicola]|uniref:hypothetical protein n=1 Tax=Streptomyces acidicola TaxID=2596892 RepID=UPI0037B50F3F